MIATPHTPPVPSLAELRTSFRRPPREARPMVRWWWFGPAVETAELDRELQAMADAGLGGAEVAYVYPWGPVDQPFLSDGFLAALRHAADRAHELGLRFDLTLGSGWSFGGPHVTPDLAARKLVWERREVAAAAADAAIAPAWPGDELVAAWVGEGSLQESPRSWQQLAREGDALRIPAGRGGPRVVLTATSRLTGQNVKRAAVGAEGLVLDHYSAAAIAEHLRAVGDRLLGAVPAELVGSVFCDSLEVYGSDWTPAMETEFAARRGYELAPLLHLLVVDDHEGLDEGRADRAAAVRADVIRTLTELYEENFIAVCREWAAGHGLPFRIQSYGTPPGTVSSYRHADLVEGEGWGWTEITQTKWASSAANLLGRPLVSSETWTWVHSPSFRATPLDLQGEAHEHLLAGINHFIGHGWPYSPSGDARGPGVGWIFYASGSLDDRNPWWPVMPELTTSLARLAWLFRQGRRVADVKLYVPARDVAAEMTPVGELDLWDATRHHIPESVPAALRRGGWDYDLLDDDATDYLAPEDADVVLLSAAVDIPASTRRWLDAVVAAGGRVATADADLAGAAPALGEPDIRIEPAQRDVGAVHRRIGAVDAYLVANTGAVAVSFVATPRDRHAHWEQWDARTGDVTASGSAAGIPLTLAPYEAAVLVLHDDDPEAPVVSPATATEAIELAGPWTVDLDGATTEVALPHRWEATHPAYAGTAVYATSFTLDAVPEHAWLDLGETSPVVEDDARDGMRGKSFRAQVVAPVRDAAGVTVNGIPCGSVWAPPFVVDVAAALRPGVNELRIAVHSTLAPAVAADDTLVAADAESRGRYGWRTRVQDLGAVLDGVSSGLQAVPRLRMAPR